MLTKKGEHAEAFVQEQIY